MILYILLLLHLSFLYYPFQPLLYQLIFIVSQGLISLIIQPCGTIMLHRSNQAHLFFNYWLLPFIWNIASSSVIHTRTTLVSLNHLFLSFNLLFPRDLFQHTLFFRIFLVIILVALAPSYTFSLLKFHHLPNLSINLHLSRLTTTNLINNFPLDTSSPLFLHPKFKASVQQQPDDIPTIYNSVVDPLHPVPETSYLSCSTIFNGWFGIPFNDANCFTYVRSPQPTEILRLYGLSFLIPLYPWTLSALQIRTFVLHVLSSRISHHIEQNFLSDAVPPAIPPPTHRQCISNFFTLQPLPAKHNWEEAYQKNSETKMFLDYLFINAPLNQSTIRTLPAAYRTAIARNQIKLLSGRLVYYEQNSFAHKCICRIVVPLSLRRKYFVLMHASPVAGHMGEYKTLYRIRLRFFLPI